MLSTLTTAFFGIALTSTLVMADGAPFTFCTEGTCTDCPSSVSSAGTGYPACVVYNSDTVFAAGDFNASAGGGYEVYVDVPQPGSGCRNVIKSPADVNEVGCGTVIGSYPQATCSILELKETFLVQFCCGVDDCANDGGPPADRMIRGMDYRSAPASGGFVLRDLQGNEIAPLQIGQPINTAQIKEKKSANSSASKLESPIEKRSCNSATWTVSSTSVNGKDGYTTSASAVQVVYGSVNGGTGGTSVTVTDTRESSFSSTVMAGVNLEVFTAGVSFTYEESESSSVALAVPIPAGSVGELGFTPTLRCTDGTLVCDGATSTGTACTGFMDAGDVAGVYAVIEES